MSWEVPGSLCIVCPRYGTEVLGGAETVVRHIAERLVARDLPVEIATTCAVDHFTWDNAFPAGTTAVNGVIVHRFPVQKGDERRRRVLGDLIGSGGYVSLAQQETWLNEGFRSAELFHYLMRHHERYHTIMLTPYMFWTTYACAQIAPHKNVLRPCLHDEPFARLQIYGPIFRDARGMTFNSEPEADLARQLFQLPPRAEVVGEGMDVPEGADASRFRERFGISGDFLLYAGRREWGKNVDVLISHFGRFISRTGRDLKLVITGRGEIDVPRELGSYVVDLGFLSEQDKLDAFAASTVVCQPSRWESFSRLIMDAWLAGKPVLAFSGCAVTAHHARVSKGGLLYIDDLDFEVSLSLLLDQPGLRDEMGANGRRYVLERYRWDDVIDRLVGCLNDWAKEPAGIG